MLYLVTFIQSAGISKETFMLDAFLLTKGYKWRIQMAQWGVI